MIEYDIGNAVYVGKDIDDIVKQIKEENIEKNRKFPGRNPYPVDYKSIYLSVTKGLENLGKIKRNTKVSHRQRGKRSVDFRGAVNAAKSIVNISHGKVVSQEEMTRRASICSNCDLLSKNTGCGLCKFGAFITSTVNAIRKMSNRPISYPTIRGITARDANCNFCGCSHVMILPATMDCFNESEEKNLARPSFCWIKKGGINYIPPEI